MIQVILGIILVLIGVFVFVKYPIKSDVKQLTLGALFIVLTIVLKRLAIMVPFLGFPSFKVTLEVLPLIIAGLVLKPGYCYIVAIASDGLGLVLANAGGFPFFGFTLNAVLQTLIPCFLTINLSKNEDKNLGRFVIGLMTLLGVIASGYVISLNEVSIGEGIYEITPVIKGTVIAIIIVMISLLFIVMKYYKKRLSRDKYHTFNIVVLSVVAIELSVTLFLTPYWLETMYGIPFFASQFIRILKSCVMIPVSIVIVYTVYNIIKRTVKVEG